MSAARRLTKSVLASSKRKKEDADHPGLKTNAKKTPGKGAPRKYVDDKGIPISALPSLGALAVALGVPISKVKEWKRLSGAPVSNQDGSVNLRPWQLFVFDKDLMADDDLDSVESHKKQGLKLKNRKLELDIAESEGLMTKDSIIAEDLFRIGSRTNARLNSMESDMPAILVGLNEAEMQLKLRERLDVVRNQLAEDLSKLPYGQASRD